MAEPQATSSEAVKAYMRSRSIYQNGKFALVVDGFRYVRAYKNLLQTEAEKAATDAVDGTATPRCGVESKPTVGGKTADAAVLYFLSHFHSDHYTGLSPAWCHGFICCSRGTAAMVRTQLGVLPEYIYAMDMNCTYRGALGVVASPPLEPLKNYKEGDYALEETPGLSSSEFVVRMVSSNHCPGAVMFLLYSPAFGYLLHTGDFRFNGKEEKSYSCGDKLPYEEHMEDNPYLQHASAKIATLYLDNTFCSPSFDFPSQRDVSRVVIDTVYSRYLQAMGSASSDQRNEFKTFHVAVLIGSYTIGKERIALELQRAFPASPPALPVVGLSTRVYHEQDEHPLPILVSPSKMKMLSDIEFFPYHFKAYRSSDHMEEGKAVQRVILEPPQRYPVQHPGIGAAESSGAPFFLTIYLVPMGCIGYSTFKSALPPHDGASSRSEALPVSTAAAGGSGRDSGVLMGDPLLELEKGVFLNVGAFDHIVGVEPTGFAKKYKRSPVGSKGTRISVPYSEHCSFREMIDFVRFMNPKKIVPTVDVEQYKKNESLFVERAPRLLPSYGTVPLSRLFSVQNTRVQVSEKKSLETRKISELDATKVGIVSLTSAPAAPRNPFSVKSSKDKDGKGSGFIQRTLAAVCLASGKKRSRSVSVDSAQSNDCVLVNCDTQVFEISDSDDE